MENLSAGQLPPVLWCSPIGLLSPNKQKKRKKKETPDMTNFTHNKLLLVTHSDVACMSLQTSKEDEQVTRSKLSWSIYKHMELQKLGSALTKQRKNDDSHVAIGMNCDVASMSSWSKSYI
jgi:hypothetical protein